MKVCYDNQRDIVSIYFEEESEVKEKNCSNNLDVEEENTFTSSNVYNTEKAANLILDTVDIVSNGTIVGFRVFNASKYYDTQLLSVADKEELKDVNLLNRPVEKVIATVTKEGVLN